MKHFSKHVMDKFDQFGYKLYYCSQTERVILYYGKEDYQFSVSYADYVKSLENQDTFEAAQLLFFQKIIF